MSSSNPWNIYAEQLFPVGYGYPLWSPEPSDGYEVSIGDVGYLVEGKLWTLFNSMHEAANEENHSHRSRRFPSDYHKLHTANIVIGKEDNIKQDTVCSRSICSIEVQGDIGGGGGGVAVNGNVSFKFQSSSDCGAFTVLVPPGHSENIHSRGRIAKYMKDNFESWMQLANSLDDTGLGLDLKESDLMFVCGTTKTSHWGVAAFQDSMYREKSGSVSASLGSSANAQFSINISNKSLPTSYYRYGPTSEHVAPTAPMIQLPGYDRPSDAASPKRDQCIFIHYFKMKRRLWFLKGPMLAGAGPHQLPPGGPNDPEMDIAMADAEGSVYELEPERYPTQEETYDPVNDLLDYILQVSEAEIAIACDLDIIAIFQNEDFPRDVAAALIRAAPHIEVDEHGVGTVSTSHSFEKRRAEEHYGEDVATPVQGLTKDSKWSKDAQFAMQNEQQHPGLSTTMSYIDSARALLTNTDDTKRSREAVEGKYWAEHSRSMKHSNSIPAQAVQLGEGQPSYIRVYPHIPIAPHEGGRPVPGQPHTVYFRTVDGHELPLLEALIGQCTALVRRDEAALPNDVSEKLSIRIKFEGCNTSHTRQMRTHSSSWGGQTITFGALARKIAKEMETFLKMARTEGAPLRFHGEEVTMNDLLLDCFVQAPAGSWYPMLKVRAYINTSAQARQSQVNLGSAGQSSDARAVLLVREPAWGADKHDRRQP